MTAKQRSPVEDRTRILVAEDDAEFRHLLNVALTTDGYQVVEARDGAELLRYFKSESEGADAESFDLVISDLRMPGVSGLEALDSLRRFDTDIPFILITAFGDRRTHDRARKLGASVIDKPFDVQGFRRILYKLLPPRWGRYPEIFLG